MACFRFSIRFARTCLPACLLGLMAAAPAAAAPPRAVALPAEGELSLAQLKARYEDPASRYAEIGGMAIRYKDEGKGPAIVLLHGSHSSLDGYDDLARSLAAHYRVIRFDMPGMGLSETLPADAATTTPYGDDILKALLDRLGVRSAALVGVSSGGAIAYYFASRHPDRVSALILSNVPSAPVINANTPRTPELRAQFEIAERTGFRSRDYWSVYLHWLTGTPDRMTAGKIDRYYDMNRRTKTANARLFWRSTMHVPEIYQAMAAVRAPALLVWGRIDFVLPIHTMDNLKNHLPASSVSTIILDDTGHYPPFEVPDRFSAIARTYLETVISGK